MGGWEEAGWQRQTLTDAPILEVRKEEKRYVDATLGQFLHSGLCSLVHLASC